MMNNRRRLAWMRRNQEVIPVVDPTVSSQLSIGYVNVAWGGITRGPNGLLYCAPRTQANFLEIDPVNKTFRIAGTSTTGQATGAVRHPNGKIYGTPRSGQIKEYDPVSDTTILVGSTFDGFAGILVPSGEIMCFPYNSNSFLFYDPATGTQRTVPSINRFVAGCLAENGKVYLVSDIRTCYEYDLSTDTYVDTGLALNNCWNIILLQNGNIGCLDSVQNRVKIFNPDDWASGFVHNNFYGAGASGGTTWGSILLKNGNFAGLTSSRRYVESDIDGNISITDLTSEIDNTVAFYGTVLSEQGKIWGCPYRTSYIHEIEIPGSAPLTSSEFDFPASLVDLPTSNWNKYFNHF